MNRFLRTSAAPLVLFLLSILPFLFWLPAYFVADDWPVLLRNSHVSFSEVPHWFTEVRYGWYRPLFELSIAIQWRLFGLAPSGYRLVGLCLFGIAALLVGKIGQLLTNDARVGRWGTIFFALQACHSTAVMWIASANELLAGALALTSITCYILYRQQAKLSWYWCCLLACVLAIMAKETALFVPLIFLSYDFLIFSQTQGIRVPFKTFLPGLSLLLLICLQVLAHPPGKATTLAIEPLMWLKNVIYYLAMQWLAIPTRFNEIDDSILAMTTLFFATAGLLLLGSTLLRVRAGLARQDFLRRLSFAMLLTLLALLPVMFEIWERTTFLSSSGVAITLALLFVNRWDAFTQQLRVMRPITLVALLLWLLANTLTLFHRNQLWSSAGEVNKSVVEQLAFYTADLSPSTEIQLLNLPDRFEDTFVFRNSFPSAAILKGYPQPVVGVLDVEVAKLVPAACQQLVHEPTRIRLWYNNGRLDLAPEKPCISP